MTNEQQLYRFIGANHLLEFTDLKISITKTKIRWDHTILHAFYEPLYTHDQIDDNALDLVLQWYLLYVQATGNYIVDLEHQLDQVMH